MGPRELPWQRSRVVSGRLALADQGGEYSRAVRQQTWICSDLDGRPGTVACGIDPQPGSHQMPGTGSLVAARLFQLVLAPMRGTVHAGTLLTWRRSVS